MEEHIVKFMFWLKENREWIYDSLEYSEGELEGRVRYFYKEYLDKQRQSKTD